MARAFFCPRPGLVAPRGSISRFQMRCYATGNQISVISTKKHLRDATRVFVLAACGADGVAFRMPPQRDAAMDETAFKHWLDKYRQAWENRNPEAAAELYTEEGSYQVTPFVEPLRGREEIRKYWAEVARTEQDISFWYEILSVGEGFGVAHWRASFEITPQELRTNLDGIFLIKLDATGKCTSLQEWWHKQQ